MIKKIKTSQLRPGMFVHDFNCGWLENPFFSDSILIENERMIEKVVRQGIKEVYIDTGKGADAQPGGGQDPSGGEGPTKKEPVPMSKVVLLATFEERVASIKPVALGDELPGAIKLSEKAEAMLKKLFDQARDGKITDLAPVRSVSEEMVESALRNNDALPCVLKVRKTAAEYLRSRALNVSSLMIAFSKHLGMAPGEIVDIAIGSFVYDIGMLRIDRAIVESRRKLTPDEFNAVKKHVSHSREMLSGVPGISDMALELASLHHERYNGTGYPDGLSGEKIPRHVRMISLVDIYDAITTKRAYSDGVNLTLGNKKLLELASLEEIDDKLTQSFISFIGVFPIGSIVHLSSKRVGIVIKQNAANLLKPVIRIIYDERKGGFVHPKDVDLLNPPEERNDEKIVYGDPKLKQRIDPITYITTKLASY